MGDGGGVVKVKSWMSFFYKDRTNPFRGFKRGDLWVRG